MNFRYTKRRSLRSPAQRSVIMAQRGMVASSQPLATQSGLKVLQKGGNAVDAAVAMLATLSVVEPQSVGLGGDAFALIWMAKEKRLLGLNGSGRAPLGAEVERFLQMGLESVPERGVLSVTVPGALHGWNEALKRCGTMDIGEVLEDAIFYAEKGFPVTEIIAGEWSSSKELLARDKETARVFLPGGRAPMPGEVFRNPDLARTLRRISEQGIEVFYGGEIGRALVETCVRKGGLLTLDDLKGHTSNWVEPISTTYRGYTVYELPPNSQGITVLEMLNVLEGYDLRAVGHNTAQYIHLLVEAKKAAFMDRDRWIGDPLWMKVPLDGLVSKRRGEEVRKLILPHKALVPTATVPCGGPGETVYVAAVDSEGNSASFISSIFMHFGSGIVAQGTGIVIQNRGCAFRLDPSHPNCIAPCKRPMHTIIPGMLFRNGEFLMSFGVMGGDMQPQGHVQFLANVIDFEMNLQEALDSPRVRHMGELEVYVEEGISQDVREGLARMGHEIVLEEPEINQVGGGQAIYRDPASGVLLGASDRRKDGCAMGF